MPSSSVRFFGRCFLRISRCSFASVGRLGHTCKNRGELRFIVRSLGGSSHGSNDGLSDIVLPNKLELHGAASSAFAVPRIGGRKSGGAERRRRSTFARGRNSRKAYGDTSTHTCCSHGHVTTPSARNPCYSRRRGKNVTSFYTQSFSRPFLPTSFRGYF